MEISIWLVIAVGVSVEDALEDEFTPVFFDYGQAHDAAKVAGPGYWVATASTTFYPNNFSRSL